MSQKFNKKTEEENEFVVEGLESRKCTCCERELSNQFSVISEIPTRWCKQCEAWIEVVYSFEEDYSIRVQLDNLKLKIDYESLSRILSLMDGFQKTKEIIRALQREKNLIKSRKYKRAGRKSLVEKYVNLIKTYPEDKEDVLEEAKEKVSIYTFRKIVKAVKDVEVTKEHLKKKQNQLYGNMLFYQSKIRKFEKKHNMED